MFNDCPVMLSDTFVKDIDGGRRIDFLILIQQWHVFMALLPFVIDGEYSKARTCFNHTS